MLDMADGPMPEFVLGGPKLLVGIRLVQPVCLCKLMSAILMGFPGSTAAVWDSFETAMETSRFSPRFSPCEARTSVLCMVTFGPVGRVSFFGRAIVRGLPLR